MYLLKLLPFFIPFSLYATTILTDKEHDNYQFIKWINENSLAFDILIIFLLLSIVLFIYLYRINTKLSQKQKELEEQKLALDEHSIVSITDIKGNITYINKKFIQISGYTEEELLGKNHRILNSGQYDSLFWKNMYKTVSQGKVWKNSNICNMKKDGSYYWVDTIIVPFMKNNKPDHYLAIRTDITENKMIESELEELYDEAQEIMKEKEKLLKEIEKLAYNDTLTNIPNRLSIMKSFEKVLASAIRNELPISVMFIDLDGFKLINDTLGHETGDRVLKEVALTLQSTLRKDDLYGRLGGDEFIVITVGISEKKKLEHLCQKLLTNICKIELPPSVQENFGASIGVVHTLAKKSTTCDILLKESDNIMYKIKNSGKNSFLINEI